MLVERGGGVRQHTALEIECTCSISRAERWWSGRQHAALEIEEIEPRFRGQREVVMIVNTPPVFTLVFEGGGMCSVSL